MANLVFILGSYHPDYSAVSICARNVISELKANNNITVICEQQGSNQKLEEEFDGYKIIRINPILIRLLYLNKQKYKYEVLNKLFNYVAIGVRALRFFNAIFSLVNRRDDVAKAYEQALKRLNEKVSIDVIIPCSYPIESIIASNRFAFHNRNVKVIPYLFDNYVDGNLHRYNWNRLLKKKLHVKYLEGLIKNSYKIVSMHSLQVFFGSNLPALQNKICYLEHPLLLPIEFNEPKACDLSYIKLVYAGSFIKNYVEPNYLLEVIFRLRGKLDFMIHFFIMGNVIEMVKSYEKKCPKNIYYGGSVDYYESLRQINSSNILVNISEVSGKQMSSKIFTYMSAGKPIINFYSARDDVNVKILKNYPLALCVNQEFSNIDSNVIMIKEFIFKNKFNTIPFDRVKEIYSDAIPKNTATYIESLIKET